MMTAVALPTMSSATTVRGFTTQGMVREAAAVVRGKVVAQHSLYNADKSRIYTESTLRVTETITGKVTTKDITVRQMGGTVGQVTMFVSGVAQLPVGQEVLLFLRTDGARYYLVGMAQGKYRVAVIKGREVVTRRLEGLNIMDKVTDPHKASMKPEPDVSYADFKAQILTFAAQKKVPAK